MLPRENVKRRRPMFSHVLAANYLVGFSGFSFVFAVVERGAKPNIAAECVARRPKRVPSRFGGILSPPTFLCELFCPAVLGTWKLDMV